MAGEEETDDVKKAGEIILALLDGQKRDMEKKLAETRDERVDSMEQTRSMLEKHVGEKAFIAAKQKETMARSVGTVLEGELGEIVKRLDKEIGLKAFLSANARDRVEALKRIDLDPDHFKTIQDAIGATVATHAIASERIRASHLPDAGGERAQRIKDATEKIERSDAITARVLRADREKTQVAQMGSKDERATAFKESVEKLEQDEKLKERLSPPPKK